ncbi:hypothetical protein Gotur_000365, partial [Gossypium turneri]
GPPYRQPTAGATVHGGRETKSLPFFPPNGLLVLLIAPALVKQVRMMGHKRRKWGESVVVVAATISEGPRCGVPRKLGVCNGNIYGNCIVPIGSSYRPCTVYTRCKRGVR